MSDGKSLGRSATRGAATTFGGQIARITVQLAGVVILARFLSPADYGVVAMVTAIIGVGEIFRDFGLSWAVVQAREVTRAQRTNLFWLNTAIGTVLAILVCALSWPIAMVYGRPELQQVAVALSATFVLNGMITQYRAHLNRDLKLVRLTTVEVVGQLGGLGLGIYLAMSGAGYWALIAQQVSQLILQLILLVAVSRWLPGLPRRGVPIGNFIRFGANLAGGNLLQYASRNVDSVVIGATSGPVMLGLYNRAFQLMMLPLTQVNSPTTRVALPVLSRLQDQRERFADFLAVGQITALNVVFSIVALCAAQAGSIIDISLGSQWTGAVPLFQILAIAGIFEVAGFTSYWVYLAKGLTGAQLRFTLISRPIMVGMVIIGGFWGVYGVAIAYTTAIALLWPTGLWWLSRVSDAPVRMMAIIGARTILVYSWAAAVSFASVFWLPAQASLLRIIVGAFALLAALGLAALVVPAYRRDVKRVFALRTYLRRQRSGRHAEAETQDARQTAGTDETN